MEIFGKEIIDENKTIKCLGIFNYYAKRNMDNRYNYLFLGEFDKIKIIGHKSQFSLIYDINKEKCRCCIRTTKRKTINKKD